VCLSLKDGGRRCVAQTRPGFQAALKAATLAAHLPAKGRNATYDEHTNAVTQHARTTTGAHETTQAINAADTAGDTEQAAWLESCLNRGRAMAEADRDTLTAHAPPATATTADTRRAIALLTSDHPIADDIAVEMTDLDDAQRLSVITDHYGLARRRLERGKTDPTEAVPLKEWADWNHTRADQLDAAAARAEARDAPDLADDYRELADRYRAAAHGPAPDRLGFVVAKESRRRVINAVKSLDREARLLAGLHDIDPDHAVAAIRKARADYLALPETDRPEPEPWHTYGLNESYKFGDAIKRPPSDPATAWALYATLTDPYLTAHYPRRRTGTAVFDLETTGFAHSSPILQVTVNAYDADGNFVDKFSTLVQPPPDDDGTLFTGTPDTVAVHGITPDMVRDAPTFDQIAPRIRTLMNGRSIAGHNVFFDYPKVQRGLNLAGLPVLDRTPIIDTLRLARWVAPNPGVPTKEWRHTLQAACEREGLPFDPAAAHNSDYDVDRTAALLFSLRRRLREQPTPAAA
jgi:DNA polymerase III epsilon subunit-like protein